MAETTLRGNPIHTAGDLPAIGSSPSFTVTKGDLQNLTNDDLKGSKVVLNIFPSIDTPTCAASVRQFNQLAADRDGATVVNVSADLPFAQAAWRARSRVGGTGSSLGDPPPPRPPGEAT